MIVYLFSKLYHENGANTIPNRLFRLDNPTNKVYTILYRFALSLSGKAHFLFNGGNAMVLREITVWAIIVRILTAILVGGIIGMERELKNRPAGMRTYMLVCVGSCLIMLTNQYLYQVTHTGDPMLIYAGITLLSGAGLAYLGLGKKKEEED